MTVLDEWVTRVETSLGTGAVTDSRALLDLVREVAHNVDRPAGPLTAFVVGVAVGRGMDLEEAIALASAEVEAAGLKPAGPPPHGHAS